MSKTTCVISCPIDCYSGYSARSRDFIKALIKTKPEWDIKILSQRWGNTRFGYLKDHKEVDLISKIIDKIEDQPDVWIQITVPNEFQKIGKYNIGVTAGIETTVCDVSWIQGCNNMDLIITSSEHSKNVFINSVYSKEDSKTKGIIGKVEITTPIEVLFEGADINKYFPAKSNKELEINKQLDGIKESFCYLVVGHWMQGDLGQDRKNIGYTLKSFLETFKNKPNSPALILKTHQVTTSIMDREKILDKIDSIRKTVKGTVPNVYLLHGEVSDEEINELYNHSKVKAMISLTKGEGFGRPLLEFSLTNKPIIASAWSAHLDFLHREYTTLIGGTLTKVHSSASVPKVILPEASWFTPDAGEVSTAYKGIVKDYKKLLELAKRQGHRSRSLFSFDAMTELLGKILDEKIPIFPKKIELNLPKLELPKL